MIGPETNGQGDPLACPRCGGVLQPRPPLSAVEVVVCQSCGLEFVSRAVPDIAAFRADDEYRRYRVVVRWPHGGPSATDLAALRELSPRLAEVPIAELARQARERRELAVAEDFIGPARNLQEQARQRGLAVDLVPVAGSTG